MSAASWILLGAAVVIFFRELGRSNSDGPRTARFALAIGLALAAGVVS